MDLNRNMQSLQDRFLKVKSELKDLLVGYEELHHEINKLYVRELSASKTSEGLEDFYRLLQTIRRNRDVTGSLYRGSQGLRPVDKFSFVEEDIPAEPVKKEKKKKEPEYAELASLLNDKNGES